MNQEIYEDVQVIEELQDIRKNIQRKKASKKTSHTPVNHLNILDKRGHDEFQDDSSSDDSGSLIR